MTGSGPQAQLAFSVRPETHIVPVPPRVVHAKDRAHQWGTDTTDSLQDVADYPPLVFQLARVVYVLPMAPAAISEVWARRLDAVRGGRVDLDYAGTREVPLILHDLCRYFLAGDTVRHKNDLALMASEGVATVSHSLEF
jgi:hypothetical protein